MKLIQKQVCAIHQETGICANHPTGECDTPLLEEDAVWIEKAFAKRGMCVHLAMQTNKDAIEPCSWIAWRCSMYPDPEQRIGKPVLACSILGAMAGLLLDDLGDESWRG